MSTRHYRRATAPVWEIVAIWTAAAGVIASGGLMVWLYNIWR